MNSSRRHWLQHMARGVAGLGAMGTVGTAQMVFSVAQVIAHLSQYQTLLPGDLIVTGTPAGVGLGMQPPQFL